MILRPIHINVNENPFGAISAPWPLMPCYITLTLTGEQAKQASEARKAKLVCCCFEELFCLFNSYSIPGCWRVVVVCTSCVCILQKGQMVFTRRNATNFVCDCLCHHTRRIIFSFAIVNYETRRCNTPAKNGNN